MQYRTTRRRGIAIGALIAAVVMVVAGCAPVTVKQTNRANDYAGKPTRLFVIAAKGMGWGAEFSDAFQQKFSELAGQCGAVTTYEEVTGLELDLDRATATRAQQFNADTALFIAQGGGTIMMPAGNRISIHYSATLRDIAQRRAVWRGSFDFGRGGNVIPLAERGAVFAIDLSNSLKEDGLLQGANCRTVLLGRGGRLEDATGGPPSAVSGPVKAAPARPPQAAQGVAAPAQATGQAVSLQDLSGLLPPPAISPASRADGR